MSAPDYGTLYNPGTHFDSARMIHGTFRREYPIPREPTHYLISASFNIKRSAYSRPAYNTTAGTLAAGTFSSHYFVNDEIESEVGEMMRFRRTWTNLPATWSDGGTISFQFPGIVGEREAWTKAAAARIEHVYYRLDGTTYTSPADIPIVGQFAPYLTAFGAWAVVPYVDTTTTPTAVNYKAGIGSTEVAAEPSALELYIGNIYVRRTPYIKYA
jgi:hypothetical protein